jgi:excisionase family DNA binding protein
MAIAELSLKREAIGVVGNTSGTDRSREKHELLELLTVDEVAALLKVSRSWVYEHSRKRGTPRSGRLPHIKVGKYVRFEPQAVRAFLAGLSRIA